MKNVLLIFIEILAVLFFAASLYAGFGGCQKCSCKRFEGNSAGGQCQSCGHGYYSHWAY